MRPKLTVLSRLARVPGRHCRQGSTMRIRWIMAGSALLTLAGLLAVPAGVARAATFSLSSFDDVVVDAAHGHVFVSPGYDYGNGSNEIVVTTYVPAYDTLFSAVFSGDAKYSPETAHARLGVRVSVTQADTGWYASTTYGGVLYRVYHQSSLLKLTTAVAPNKHGECVALEIAVYAQGRWQSLGTGSCGTLDSASKTAGEVNLSGTAGYRLRLRVDFVHNDATSLANDSSWFYFSVTK